MTPTRIAGITPRDAHEQAYIDGKRGTIPDDHLAEDIRQYRAINASNEKADESGDAASPDSASPDSPSLTERPGLSLFLDKSRPLNPDFSDAQLVSEYTKLYGAPDRPDLPTFLEKSSALNPDMSADQLTQKYAELYGAPGKPLGLSGTLIEGAKSTGRSIMAAGQALVGDEAGAVKTAQEQLHAPKDPALAELLKNIQARKEALGPDASWFDAGMGVGKEFLKNPKGAGLFLAEQIPNSAAVLGTAGVGMLAGLPLGPGGVIAGGLAGLFLGNTAVETGGKVIEAAGDGTFGEAEQSKALKEGAIKGAVVSTIDAATLGVTKLLTGTIARAVESATQRVLVNEGVDVTNKAAVLAARGNPEIVAKIQSAQQLARESAGSMVKRLGRGGAELGLESLGEGAGEYLGELAATGKADKTEAFLEAFAGLGQSAAEVAATSAVSKRQENALKTDPLTTAEPIMKEQTVDESIKQAEQQVGGEVSDEHLDKFIQEQELAGGTSVEQNKLVQQHEADQKTLEDVFQKWSEMTDPTLFNRTTLGATFKNAAIKNIPVYELPEKTPADSHEMSQEKYKALSTMAEAIGKRIVIFKDGVGVQGFAWRQQHPDTIFMADKAQENQYSVFTHEAFHLAEGTKFHDALRKVIQTQVGPMGVQIARARHGTHLNDSQLLNEIVSDTAGAEFHKPELWEKVYRQLELKYGKSTAKSEIQQFLDLLGVMLQRIKNAITGKAWGYGSKSYSELYLKDVTKVHSALSKVMAQMLATAKDRKPTSSTEASTPLASLKPLKATFIGTQKSPNKDKFPDFDLYNLEEELPGHPIGSTVTKETINKHGYEPIAAPQASRTEEPHEFSSTQIDLPDLDRTVKTLASQIAPDDLVEPNNDVAHVTVKYGLHDETHHKAEALLKEERPVGMKIGKLSVFKATDERPSDVIKMEVESKDLHRLHKTLSDNLESTATQSSYNPHITVAYVKPGKGEEYARKLEHSLEGNDVSADTVQFSAKDRSKTGIRLEGKSVEESKVIAKDSVYYRANTGFSHTRGTTAADVVRFERDEHNNDDAKAVPESALKELEKYPARQIVWVTKKKSDAERYGDEVDEVVIPKGSRVIIPDDGDGGSLILIREGTKQSSEENGSTSEGRPMFSPSIWFSQMGNVLNEKMPKQASTEQVRNILKAGNVKEDEIKWTGILDYLEAQTEPIQKAALLDWLKLNNVKVEEVVKKDQIQKNELSDLPDMGIEEFNQNWHRDVEQMRAHDREDVWTNRDFPHVLIRNTDDTEYWHVQIGEKFLESDGSLADEYASTNAFNSMNAATEAAYEHLVAEPIRREAAAHTVNPDLKTKFDGYVLSGGTDYTELLLKLPDDALVPDRAKHAQEIVTAAGESEEAGEAAIAKYGMTYKEAIKLVKLADYPEQYIHEHHFQEPNIIAHVRFKTRKDGAGKAVLFLEEVQSDWHEAGREHGYKTANPTLKDAKEFFAISDENWAKMSEDQQQSYLTEMKEGIAKNDLNYTKGLVPDAPFKKSWPELALKRMLRWAAEHNYDRLAWTTGAQQNERYGLAKHGVEISYFWNDTRTVNVRINDQNGRAVYTNNDATAEDLNGVVGRELTQKIVQGQGRPQEESYGRENLQVKILSGLDLEVGGSGMKYFYDQMLPKFMEKYLKRFGTRVDALQIDVGTPGTKTGWETTGTKEGTVVTVHSIALTDAMKESVINQGQPMFAPKRASMPYTIDQPGLLDRIVRLFQDKTIDMTRVAQAIKKFGGVIPDQINPVLREEMYQKRAEQRSKDFTTDELQPLIDQMRLGKVTQDELNEYLHARHVIVDEVNQKLQDINPDLAGTPDFDRLSGMTDAEAQQILDAARPVMRQLASKVDGIVERTRDLMVSYGLETQDRIDSWRETYDAYVPLRRGGFTDEGMPTGTGYSVRGSTVKQRGGSGLDVVNILANIAQARDQIITRGEKNRVSTAFAGMMMLYPHGKFARLTKPAEIEMVDPTTGLTVNVPGDMMDYKVPRIRRFDPVTGAMKTYPDPTYKGRDNVVNFRVKGKDYAIIFDESDVRAMEVSKGLKNLDTPKLTGIFAAVAPYTRYLAAINTQYNPIFGIVNFVRDSQYAMLTLTSTEIAGKQHVVLRNAIKSLKGIYQDARDIRYGRHGTSAVAQLWERFEAVGGPTGYRDLFLTAQDRADEIERMLDPKSWTNIRNPQDLGKRMEETPLFRWLSDYNLAMENAIRLGVFKTAIDAGISDIRAASMAKNITVNFNKKGQIGAQMGALYAFFNANVQGTARIAETLFERTATGFKLSSKGKKLVTGGLLLGVLQTFALTMAGFGDDDPPEFVKQKNLIIPVPGTKKGYAMIPMPLGFNLIPNVGRLAAEVVTNAIQGKPLHVFQKASSLFSGMYNALSPLGGAGVTIQEFTPTVGDPLVALMENKDWTGKAISKEDHSTLDPTPGHSRVHDTATAWAKGLSYAINWATGGTEHTPGALSPTPDAIDYFISQLTGGIGREVSKTAQLAKSTYTGEEMPLHKIPLAGRFMGSATGSSAIRSRFYDNIRDANIAYNEFEGRARQHESFGEYLKAHPEARYAKVAATTQKDLAMLQKQKRFMLKNGASRDAIQAQEQKVTSLMERFNRLVEKAEEGVP